MSYRITDEALGWHERYSGKCAQDNVRAGVDTHAGVVRYLRAALAAYEGKAAECEARCKDCRIADAAWLVVDEAGSPCSCNEDGDFRCVDKRHLDALEGRLDDYKVSGEYLDTRLLKAEAEVTTLTAALRKMTRGQTGCLCCRACADPDGETRGSDACIAALKADAPKEA